jgi:hypothetical protein
LTDESMISSPHDWPRVSTWLGVGVRVRIRLRVRVRLGVMALTPRMAAGAHLAVVHGPN